jgi:hypothetical protein
VPGGTDLWSAHDVASGHFRRYTRETLTEVIEKAGLVIDALWSWNVLLRPVVKLRRRNVTEAQSEHDVTAVHPVVNFALGLIVRTERFLPLRSLPGVSLMLRAHRPA